MTFVGILIAWLFSLCLHEFAHALVAYKGGDYTVKEKGYLSFNPLAYTDVGMSLVWPLVILAIGGIPLPGGAVYIERERLKGPKWETAVSLSGPGSNLGLAILLSIPLRLGLYGNNAFWAGYAMFVHLQILAVLLNLLPIPPLDGFGAIEPWLNWRTRAKIRPYERYGILVLLAIFFLPNPIRKFFYMLVNYLAFDVLRVPRMLALQGWEAFSVLGNLLGR